MYTKQKHLQKTLNRNNKIYYHNVLKNIKVTLKTFIKLSITSRQKRKH